MTFLKPIREQPTGSKIFGERDRPYKERGDNLVLTWGRLQVATDKRNSARINSRLIKSPMRHAEGTVWNQWRSQKLGRPQSSARSSPTNPSPPAFRKEPFVMCPLRSAHCDAALGEGKCSSTSGTSPPRSFPHISTREEKPSLVKVSSLQTNLQVSYFQRRKCVFRHHQAWVKAAACPPSPIADNPSALPSPTSSPSSSQELLLCSLDARLCIPAVVLYYCALQGTILKDLNIFFTFCACLFFMYYLCEKYYKPITVWYHEADCVSRVPRLTLLDLWIGLTNMLSECMQGIYCQCFCQSTG